MLLGEAVSAEQLHTVQPDLHALVGAELLGQRRFARGKRRLHQSPDAGDITFYRPFLLREIGFVQPRLIVTLGATALRAVSGRAMQRAVTDVVAPKPVPVMAPVDTGALELF